MMIIVARQKKRRNAIRHTSNRHTDTSTPHQQPPDISHATRHTNQHLFYGGGGLPSQTRASYVGLKGEPPGIGGE